VTERPTARSPHLLRRINMTAVLSYAWDTDRFTATDVMAATGLTRSTVLGICDELTGRGWLTEVDPPEIGPARSLGRPARWYALRPTHGWVVGVDAGQHHITAAVGDLRGEERSRVRHSGPTGRRSGEQRRAAVAGAIADALARAGVDGDAVLAIVLAVPAPTDAAGDSPPGRGGYWRWMNPGFGSHVARPGRVVVVDNDANLAALAEGSLGAGRGVASYATLLAGERFGAGLVVDGRLLRGRRGAAGELSLLELVEGVGSTDGLAALARAWGTDLADLGEGDRQPMLDRLADRLARVCAVVVGLLDVELVVVAGGAAAAAVPVVERAADLLGGYLHAPVPRLIASDLGVDVVLLGALQRAVTAVRADPLGFGGEGEEVTVF